MFSLGTQALSKQALFLEAPLASSNATSMPTQLPPTLHSLPISSLLLPLLPFRLIASLSIGQIKGEKKFLHGVGDRCVIYKPVGLQQSRRILTGSPWLRMPARGRRQEVRVDPGLGGGGRPAAIRAPAPRRPRSAAPRGARRPRSPAAGALPSPPPLFPLVFFAFCYLFPPALCCLRSRLMTS